jgi:uncharacterized protein YjiS (DUF1127 family)
MTGIRIKNIAEIRCRRQSLRRPGSNYPSTILKPQIWTMRIRHRREVMGLLSQPEPLLKDVGLQRDEITREGLKPFWIA